MNRHYRLAFVVFLSSLFLAALGVLVRAEPVRASGATITVSTTTDEISEDGRCSLREAILAANLDTASGNVAGECPAGEGADTIILPAGIYTLTRSGANENSGMVGDLDIAGSLKLEGVTAASSIIDGGGLDRVIDVDDQQSAVTSTVELKNITIRGGRLGYPYHPFSGQGGGIWNGEALLLTNSILSDNIASGGSGGCCIPYPGGGGILNAGVLTITASTITSNTVSGGNGGGIYNEGELAILNSTLTGNGSPSGNGGGIYNLGTTTLNGSLVSGSTGAGIWNFSLTVISASMVISNTESGIDSWGTLTITASTIASNTTPSNIVMGAGINVMCCGSHNRVWITNSTLSGNQAAFSGTGGLRLPMGTADLANVTVAYNSGNNNSSGAGGIYTYCCGIVNFKNTIIAENTNSGGRDVDCSGTYLISQGYNLIGDTTDCLITGTVTGNLTGVNPNLGPLQNNGGSTLTHALLAGSLALEAGEAAGCTDVLGNPLTVDQRGLTRPQGAYCDIGAYEVWVPSAWFYLPLIWR